MSNASAVQLRLSIFDAVGTMIAERSGQDAIILSHSVIFNAGEKIMVETDQTGLFLALCLDASMPEAIIFLPGTQHVFDVPSVGDKISYPPQAFQNCPHRLSVRLARSDEISARRNLAQNAFDQHNNHSVFPHVRANVETRGEAVFAARNAIDGTYANTDHGFWPYTSWGINQDPDATLDLDFGRLVKVDMIVLFLRADFPHDAWWTRAALSFSDNSDMVLNLEKTGEAQKFEIAPRTVKSLKLHSLIKADDPSLFPALTQIEVWGHEV